MARHYTVDELLYLRKSLPFVVCDVKKLNKDISPGIILLPEEVTFGSKTRVYTSKMNRSRSNSRPYNGTDDDEERIVYRGHPARRSIREVAWHLRRRDSSDRSSQPLSAPSGLEAQKADNFQKFYRAVVSPTHVRVTAGGRIVPNTRAPPPPLFCWDGNTYHKPSYGSDQQATLLQGVRLDNADSKSYLKNNHPHVSGGSLLSPAIQQVALRLEQSSAAAQKKEFGVDTFRNTAIKLPSEDTQVTASVEEIIISPPNQFDTSKPFLYNGQWVFPVPPGFQHPVLPFSMLGNANPTQPPFMPQAQPGMFFPQQLHCAESNMTAPFPILSAAQPGPLMHFSGFAPVMMPNGSPQIVQSPHGVFPAGSFLGSSPVFPTPSVDQQLKALQQHLRHLENQLENNKHQIDEAHVLTQRDMARNHIATLLIQSNFEGRQRRHQDSTSEQSESSADITKLENHIGLGLKPVTQSESKGLTATQTISQISSAFSNSHNAVGISTSKATESVVDQSNSRSFISPSDSESSATPKPGIRKRLSAAAAMAPPFLPRNMQTNSGLSSIVTGDIKDASSVDTNPVSISKDSQKQIGIQNTSPVKLTDWKMPVPPLSMKSLPSPILHAHTLHNKILGEPFESELVASQSFPPHPCPDGAGPIGSGFSLSLGEEVPYLMGFPPRGMTFEKASSNELEYSRRLTEDEQRARYLYWGKAPREISKGLPKFDGRDFYPPSPNRRSAKITSRTFEFEFNSSPELKALNNAYAWLPDPGQSEQNLMPRTFSLNSVAEDNVEKRSISSSSGPVVRQNKPLEKCVHNGGRDRSPVDSWSVPKNVDDKFLVRSSSQPTGFGEKQSTPRKFEVRSAHAGASLSFNHPSLLQGMLKNSPRSSIAKVLTGSPSSSTAQSFLHQYHGSAAAVLAPSLSSVNALSQDLDSVRTDVNKSNYAISKAPARTENRPPSSKTNQRRDTAGAAELLRRLNRQDKEPHDPGFNANTTGVGPTFSSDW